jgi:uncharacterized membrane protein YidH (DUF202 family)
LFFAEFLFGKELYQKGNKMNIIRILAILLIIAGVMSLIYGGFNYTKETEEVKLGPIEMSVKEKEIVNIPVWAGVSMIAVGAILLLF